MLVVISLIGFTYYWDPGSIHASVDLGVAPKWEDLIFALGIASVAAIGVEAASGLAGEIRVGRRGLGAWSSSRSRRASCCSSLSLSPR